MNKAALALFVALTAQAGGAAPPAATKLVVVSWDGAADVVVDRLLDEGRLPNLARIRAEGAAAEHSRTSFPSKTAVGHAALWTGCWSECNGVTGNEVLYPGAEHTLLEHFRGFSSRALKAEPLYVTAARAGRKVVVLSATQSDPAAPHLEALRRAGVGAERYVSFSCFDAEIARGQGYGAEALRPAAARWGAGEEARELVVRVGEESFYALFYDDPQDAVSGLDSVLIRQGSRAPAEAVAEAILKPRPAARLTTPLKGTWGPWTPPFRVTSGELSGNTFFRLFELAPDGGSAVLYRRAVSGCRGSHPELFESYFAAYPGFHDEAFWRYEGGHLGTPLMAGGDGEAERRILEIVASDTELLIRGTRFALEEWRPDVLFHYSPMTDGAGHTWLGVLDPASPAYDRELAKKLWPFYAQVYVHLDVWLGEILRLAPGAVVALVSDHGMAGVGRLLYPNRVLEEAGLLHRDGDGQIDLSRTRILVPPSSDFGLKLNRRGRRGGIVGPEEAEAVLEAATKALKAVRDPRTGQPVVTRVLRGAELARMGVGGPLAGDLYLDVAPGYYPSRRLAEQAVGPTRHPWGDGVHGFWPERREMHAIFYVRGPGVRAGTTVAPVRHIDVAPTLARLVGIPAPAQATGRVVEELLVDP